MRTVLVSAYYFPPSGGPGVQRVLKMVRYLPDFGWQPVVLTVRDGTFPARDESLLEEIPSNLHVERTRILEPYSFYRRLTKTRQPIDVAVLTTEHSPSWKQRIAQWIRGTLFIPDARVGWLLDAVPCGKALVRNFNIGAIYTSSPPYTCALIGRSLKRSTYLPWVMELRDPWTGFLTTPKRWWLPARIDRYLEYSCLSTADRIVCAWEGIQYDALRKYPQLPKEKFHVIPNGFDSADYTHMPHQTSSVFTITYTGSLYGLRYPAILIAALEYLFAERTIPLDKVRIRLIGRVGEDVISDLQKSPLWPRIEIVPYIPHSKSIEALLETDVALLIVDRSQDSTAIVPGKVFEYIGARKPILALAPHGSAVEKLLTETSTGIACQTIEECIITLQKWFSYWLTGQPLIKPNNGAISHYERRNAAKYLALIFDELCAVQR